MPLIVKSLAPPRFRVGSSLLSRFKLVWGVKVDLEESTLEDLVPHCWDDDDIR